jgi:hypothetical protein
MFISQHNIHINQWNATIWNSYSDMKHQSKYVKGIVFISLDFMMYICTMQR